MRLYWEVVGWTLIFMALLVAVIGLLFTAMLLITYSIVHGDALAFFFGVIAFFLIAPVLAASEPSLEKLQWANQEWRRTRR